MPARVVEVAEVGSGDLLEQTALGVQLDDRGEVRLAVGLDGAQGPQRGGGGAEADHGGHHVGARHAAS